MSHPADDRSAAGRGEARRGRGGRSRSRAAVGPSTGPLAQEVPRRPRDFGIDVRRLRRLRLIVFSILALPLLALTLLALKFVSMPLTQSWHDAAYDRGDYAGAIERLEPVWVANWFEPYLPHLTRGTDLLQEGKNADAEKELRSALAVWEKGKDLNRPQHAQCKILNNLAISIERQADDIQDPSKRGDRLYEAEQMLGACGGGGGGSSDGGGSDGGGQGNEDKGTTGENGKRIQEKREQADKEAGKDPADRQSDQQQDDQGGDQSGSPSQSGGAPPSGTPGQREDPSGSGRPEEATTPGDGASQSKKDELDERNRQANDGDGESSEGGTQRSPEKPW